MKVDLSDAKWFKSTRSGGDRNCVEVAHLPNALVAVRDSKSPTTPALIFDSTDWSAFLAATTNGELDL
ncbi:DUF397 domain-containing protein [Nocardia pseudobrasiliensis]|uniref:Uncharacterized protein DUF397 n=1 Tax=Nocardia pseudobrasiliensis TaxID=45979 RepID=A0A370I0T0_9NOCA|nr:DUF397 domain-containing protein [Nocardia pseudobrasiliensis]RDI64348.1 uncharacterized protein DUF397 [Nocardia pseudobrasiliensis]